MAIKLKDKHPSLAFSAEVDAIFRPLKDYFGVTSFVYQSNFNDGSEIRLSNQPDWIKHFYEQGFYQISGFEKHPRHYQSGFVVWSHLTHHHPILNAARDFNIDHGMTLIQKKADGCEFYFLGTTSNRPYVTNLLLNNIDYLQHFIAYFKEYAAPLIKQSQKTRIIIPKKYEAVTSEELGIAYQNKVHPKPNLNIKRFHLDHRVLTERELTCAKLLLQGKTARDMAQQLFLSHRTVETHIQHLKEKMNCHSRAELIRKLIQLNILI